MNRYALTCVLASSLLFALSGGSLDARELFETATPQSERDLEAIQKRVQKVLPFAKRATVVVLGDGSGSGVIVSRSGLVLTAGHVCGKKDTSLMVVLPNGRLVKGVSLGFQARADAGLVQLERGRYPFARVRSVDDEVSVGTWCLALGHPGGYDPERGAILRLGRVITRTKNTLRSDCKLVGGDSGGPLFDLSGRLVGIHSRISRGADQNFHVPLATFRAEWPELVP